MNKARDKMNHNSYQKTDTITKAEQKDTDNKDMML